MLRPDDYNPDAMASHPAMPYALLPYAYALKLGLDVNGKGDRSGDPFFEDQLLKARMEKDVAKRRQLAYDIQRYLAQKAYVMRPAGASSGLSLWWPAVCNVNVYQGEFRNNYYEWLDDTQPLSKSA